MEKYISDEKQMNGIIAKKEKSACSFTIVCSVNEKKFQIHRLKKVETSLPGM